MAGWFVGQVMKATGGKANPQAVNELVKAKLGIEDYGDVRPHAPASATLPRCASCWSRPGTRPTTRSTASNGSRRSPTTGIRCASLKARLARPDSEFLVADDGKEIGGMAFAAAGRRRQDRHAAPALCAPGLSGPWRRRHAARRDPRLLSRCRDGVGSRSRRPTSGRSPSTRPTASRRPARTANCGGGQSGIPALVMERPLVAAHRQSPMRDRRLDLLYSRGPARTTSRRSSRCSLPMRVGGHGDTTDARRIAGLCRGAFRRDRQASPNDTLYVAELDGEVVGTFQTTMITSHAGDAAARA